MKTKTTPPKRRAAARPAILPLLERLGACDEARQWASRRRLSRATWQACPNGLWMEWLAAHLLTERAVSRIVDARAAADAALYDLDRAAWREDSTRFAILADAIRAVVPFAVLEKAALRRLAKLERQTTKRRKP